MKARLLALASIVTSLALGAAGLASSVQAQQQPLQKVNVGLLYLLADAGLFVALEKGYFKEQGLDVQLSRFVSGSDAVSLLAMDRLDVGSGSITPGLLNAYMRGAKAPIVSSKAIISSTDLGGNSLLVRTDLIESGRVKAIADLKGLKIAINNIQATSLNYVMRGIAKGGLGRKDVDLIEMPFEQFIPALQKKAVDVVLAYSPLANTIADRLKLAVALPEASPALTADGDTANVMFYSSSFLKSEQGMAFMVAHLKGLRDYQAAIFDGKGNRTEICAMIRKHLSYVSEDCAGIAMSAVDPNGVVNVESLERYQDEWVNWGLMRDKANIRANVDPGPLNYAIGKLGKYVK